MISTKTNSTCPLAYPKRDNMLECQICECIFTAKDGRNTCPECGYGHCPDCDTCWDTVDGDECPCCSTEDIEPGYYGWQLRTIPGTSLTYWA